MSRSRSRLVGPGVGLSSLLAALLVAEAALRRSTPEVVRAALYTRHVGEGSPLHPAQRIVQLDGELGYRPFAGGAVYDERGVVANDYPTEKPPGVRRLLFIGDSVTLRGEIVAGFRAALGEDGIEYWNAGVEGYNAVQSIGYYVRHLTDLDEDHVVFTMHMNDFLVTPICFLDPDGEVVFYESTDPVSPTRTWLLRHSALARWIHARRAGDIDRSQANRGGDVLQALSDLKEATAARGVELTVLLFSMLHPRASWRRTRVEDHDRMVDYAEELGLRYFDLVELAERARAEGLEIQAGPRDVNHPSAAFGAYVGEALVAEGFRP